jgi:putative transposase
MSRRRDDVRLAVLMVDGVELKGRTNVVCLGITTDGQKIPLGLWEGRRRTQRSRPRCSRTWSRAGSMSTRACSAFSTARRHCARRSATLLGVQTPVQRRIRHKERNVLAHLPERDRPPVKRRLPAPGPTPTTTARSTRSPLLPKSSSARTPVPAASPREGMEETLTLTRLGIRGNLRKTLESTNPCESMIECVRRTSRNVKRWQSGEMCLRWTAAGMLEAERQFRKVQGYGDLAKLAVAVEHALACNSLDTSSATEETVIVATA